MSQSSTPISTTLNLNYTTQNANKYINTSVQLPTGTTGTLPLVWNPNPNNASTLVSPIVLTADPANFLSNLDPQSTLAVDGKVQVTGLASLGSLLVSGLTTLNGVLNAGATTLANLAVSGVTTLASLTVTGATQLSGTLSASASTLASLTVSGISIMTGNTTIGGNLTLSSDTLINSLGKTITLPAAAGTLATTTQLGSYLPSNGGTVSGAFNVTGNILTTGTLYMTNPAGGGGSGFVVGNAGQSAMNLTMTSVGCVVSPAPVWTGSAPGVGTCPMVLQYAYNGANSAYQTAMIITDGPSRTYPFTSQSQTFSRLYSDGAIGVNGPISLGTTTVGNTQGTTSAVPVFTNLYGTATASRNISLPDATGTVALTSQLSSYLPLSGGTLSGGLTTGGLTLTGSNPYITSNANVATISVGTNSQFSVTGIPGTNGVNYAGICLQSTANTGTAANSPLVINTTGSPLVLSQTPVTTVGTPAYTAASALYAAGTSIFTNLVTMLGNLSVSGSTTVGGNITAPTLTLTKTGTALLAGDTTNNNSNIQLQSHNSVWQLCALGSTNAPPSSVNSLIVYNNANGSTPLTITQLGTVSTLNNILEDGTTGAASFKGQVNFGGQLTVPGSTASTVGINGGAYLNLQIASNNQLQILTPAGVGGIGLQATSNSFTSTNTLSLNPLGGTVTTPGQILAGGTITSYTTLAGLSLGNYQSKPSILAGYNGNISTLTLNSTGLASADAAGNVRVQIDDGNGSLSAAQGCFTNNLPASVPNATASVVVGVSGGDQPFIQAHYNNNSFLRLRLNPSGGPVYAGGNCLTDGNGNMSGLVSINGNTFPSTAGTLSTTAQLAGYLPLGGGTLTGKLQIQNGSSASDCVIITENSGKTGMTIQSYTSGNSFSLIMNPGGGTVYAGGNCLTDGTGKATLNITDTGSSFTDFNVLKPNCGVGQYTTMNLGVSTGQNNAMQLNFMYKGDNNVGNAATIGMPSSTNKLIFNQSGIIGTNNIILDDSTGKMSNLASINGNTFPSTAGQLVATDSGGNLSVNGNNAYSTLTVNTNNASMNQSSAVFAVQGNAKTQIGWSAAQGVFLYDNVNQNYLLSQGGTTKGRLICPYSGLVIDDGTAKMSNIASINGNTFPSTPGVLAATDAGGNLTLNSTATTNKVVLGAYVPNLGSNNVSALSFGVNGSTYNNGIVGMLYTGAGSSSNYSFLQMGNAVIKVYGNGQVGTNNVTLDDGAAKMSGVASINGNTFPSTPGQLATTSQIPSLRQTGYFSTTISSSSTAITIASVLTTTGFTLSGTRITLPTSSKGWKITWSSNVFVNTGQVGTAIMSVQGTLTTSVGPASTVIPYNANGTTYAQTLLIVGTGLSIQPSVTSVTGDGSLGALCVEELM